MASKKPAKKAPAKKAAKKPTLIERMQALNPVRSAQRETQRARNARINAATGFETAEELRARRARERKRQGR